MGEKGNIFLYFLGWKAKSNREKMNLNYFLFLKDTSVDVV